MNDRIAKIVLPVFLLLAGTHSVFANECDNRDFSGRWIVLAGGDILSVPGLPVGPFSRLALLLADGQGTLTVPHATGNYFGVIFPEPFTGTFAVTPDCFIQFLFSVPPPVSSELPFTGVLYDNANVLEMILSGFGVTIGGTLTQQKIHDCKVSDFQGGYQLRMSGVVLNNPAGFPPPGFPPQPPPPFPLGNFIRVGRVAADGAGGFTAHIYTSYNGANLNGSVPIAPEDVSGTYTVDPDLCMVTMSYKMSTAGNPTISTEALMIERNRLALMFTTPGTNIRGSMNKQ